MHGHNNILLFTLDIYTSVVKWDSNMNRKQRRAIEKERRIPALPGFFLRTGMKLFRKATRRNLDISALVKSEFDKDSLSRHNWRIRTDWELMESPDAVTSEITSVLLSMPGDSFYPEISNRNKKWLAMLGIKPKHFGYGGLGKLLLYYRCLIRVTLRLIQDMIESISLARQRGTQTFKGTPIHDKANYLISRSIANRRGHDKGRTESFNNDHYYRLKAKTPTPDEMPDTEAHTFTDQTETAILYDQLTSVIQRLDAADKLAVRTQILANQYSMSFEAAYYQHEKEFCRLDIHSPRAAKKRLRYLPQKHQELQDIRESLKR
jgi:hypothetical protein